MSFSPIVPTSQWESNRQTLNDGLIAMVAAFQGVVPNVVRKAWSEVPASLTGETPLVYVGDIVEDIRHDSGLRGTRFTGTVGYVDTSPDNQEANTRANTFIDFMRELFTANYHLISGRSLLQQTGLREVPITQGELHGFIHVVIDYEFVVLEGRD